MKKYFFTGLLILLPVFLTFFLIVFIVDFFTEPFLGIFQHILENLQPKNSPIFSKEGITIIARIVVLIVLFVLILLLGFVARWFFFKELLEFTNKIFSKIPFVKGIYNVTRDVAKAIFTTDTRTAFKKAVMVPFPCKKSTALGFTSGNIPPACGEEILSSYTPVLIPTAPHPISGILMFVPHGDIHDIDMTNEEVIKYLVSCGLILPERPKKTEEKSK